MDSLVGKAPALVPGVQGSSGSGIAYRFCLFTRQPSAVESEIAHLGETAKAAAAELDIGLVCLPLPQTATDSTDSSRDLLHSIFNSEEGGCDAVLARCARKSDEH